MLYTSNWRVVTCPMAKLVQVMVSCYILEKNFTFYAIIRLASFSWFVFKPATITFLFTTDNLSHQQTVIIKFCQNKWRYRGYTYFVIYWLWEGEYGVPARAGTRMVASVIGNKNILERVNLWEQPNQFLILQKIQLIFSKTRRAFLCSLCKPSPNLIH